MIKTELITYEDHSHVLEGLVAYPSDVSTHKAAVMIAHDWSGRNDFTAQKARQIAELGYIGFALDMYGKGIIGNTKEEKSALIQPFIQNRKMLQQRILAALHTVEKIKQVDSKRIAAMGFCFGGLCVLDLARSGADIKAVVSVHGLLNAPELPKHEIKAKVLALHGYDDPMVTPDQVMQFGNEMTEAGADWQLHMYGNTMHAFTNPQANDPGFGTVYSERADARAWVAVKDFFEEVF